MVELKRSARYFASTKGNDVVLGVEHGGGWTSSYAPTTGSFKYLEAWVSTEGNHSAVENLTPSETIAARDERSCLLHVGYKG